MFSKLWVAMCELIDMDIVKGLKDKEEINFKREWKWKQNENRQIFKNGNSD